MSDGNVLAAVSWKVLLELTVMFFRCYEPIMKSSSDHFEALDRTALARSWHFPHSGLVDHAQEKLNSLE